MRLHLPERHLQPSQRLLVGIALLAALSTLGLWPGFGRWAFLPLPFWTALLGWALAYVSGSWIRISPERGLSYCLRAGALGRSRQLGSIELHPSEIAELRLESSLGGRLLGLWDLQIVKRDGTALPRFRFFHGMDRVAEELHGYLQQG